MNVLRNIGLIVVGMLLAFGLLVGAGAVLADGPIGGLGRWTGMGDSHVGFIGAEHMHGGHHGMGDFIGLMGGRGNVTPMHGHMYGEEMPEACEEMMDDPEMMRHMMQMMHGGEPMSQAECQEWMTEHGVPPDTQAECLEHMAEHHGP